MGEGIASVKDLLRSQSGSAVRVCMGNLQLELAVAGVSE